MLMQNALLSENNILCTGHKSFFFAILWACYELPQWLFTSKLQKYDRFQVKLDLTVRIISPTLIFSQLSTGLRLSPCLYTIDPLQLPLEKKRKKGREGVKRRVNKEGERSGEKGGRNKGLAIQAAQLLKFLHAFFKSVKCIMQKDFLKKLKDLSF